MEGMSYVFSFTFFSLLLIFALHWWPLAFLIFSPPLQNFHVFSQQKKWLLCSLFLALDLCCPFSGWPLLACCLLSLFLCLCFSLYSKLADMTINLLYKTLVALQFPAKITSSCIWVAIPVHMLNELFYIGMPVVQTDGRSIVLCTVTWLPNFLGWIDFLSYGALPTRKYSATPISPLTHHPALGYLWHPRHKSLRSYTHNLTTKGFHHQI